MVRTKTNKASSLGGLAVSRALVFALLVFHVVFAHASDAVRVEGIVAILGGATPGPKTDVVLRSDLEVVAFLRSAQYEEWNQDDLQGVLDSIIGEVLITREAERIRGVVLRDRDVNRELERIAEPFGGIAAIDAAFRSQGFSPSEAREVARRRATVAAFLEANLEGVTAVTEDQLKAAYEAGTHPFVGQPLEAVREDLRSWLARQQLNEALRQWIRVLRSRIRVKVFPPFRS